MRKRVLSESGKFTDYVGPREVVKVKSGDQAVAERRELEKKAEAAGVSPNNPEEGGLSDEDRSKIEAGMSIPEMKALAKMRGVVIPAKVKTKAAIVAHLLGESEGEVDL